MLRLILALWLAIMPALADGVAVPGVPSTGQTGAAVSYAPTVSASYTGPGDVYSSTWYAWWSVARAFSAAKAGTKAINLCDHSGANCTDVLTSASTGALVAPTLIGSDNCTTLTTCQIHTIYDQSGSINCNSGASPCDMITQQFQITFTWNSGKPYGVFSSLIGTYLQPATQNSALAQPLSVTAVASATTSQTGFIFADTSNVFQPLQPNGSNSMRQNFGSGPNGATSIDGTIQSYVSIANGSSSALVIDGTATTGLVSGTNGVSGANKGTIGGPGNSVYYGNLSEIGIAPVAWTAGGASQSNSICHNERLYYGTGGSC